MRYFPGGYNNILNLHQHHVSISIHSQSRKFCVKARSKTKYEILYFLLQKLSMDFLGQLGTQTNNQTNKLTDRPIYKAVQLQLNIGVLFRISWYNRKIDRLKIDRDKKYLCISLRMLEIY